MKVDNPRIQMVELVTDDGLSRTFELEHAERILRTPNNGGWRLPDDSNYEYDYYDGITPRRTGEGKAEGSEA